MPNMPTKKKTLHLMEFLLPTPLGQLSIWLSDSNTLQAIDWVEYHEQTFTLLSRRHANTLLKITPSSQENEVVNAIKAYFQGNIHAIDSLKTAMVGTTFQQKVWKALRTIPAGTTKSYAEIAQQINSPLAFRAVGMANHCNPISIVVPCHRVIGKNQQLTGYAGRLERKEWLLNHERYYCT